MVTISIPATVLFGRKRRQHAELTRHNDNMDRPNQQGVASAPKRISIGAPAADGAWMACTDQEQRPFWLNNTTGQWMYPGVNRIMQPPPPQMMYVPQPPQQHTTWAASPQEVFLQTQAVHAPWGGAVLVPVAVPASTTGESSEEGKREGKASKNVVWPRPTWERCFDGRGKSVWIHAETGKLVHNDPYE